jgi:hypothetical protein
LELAQQINHGTSICYTLALAGVVIARYNGDEDTAQTLQALLLEHAHKHSVQLFKTWAGHYAGILGRKDLQGLGLIEDILVTLGSHALDEPGFERARAGDAGWCTPEILRIHAESTTDARAAEALLLEALGLAHQQGALAWELRCATSLARLWQAQGRVQPARDLLSSVYTRFTEGFATQDLVRVRGLLDELQDKRPA